MFDRKPSRRQRAAEDLARIVRDRPVPVTICCVIAGAPVAAASSILPTDASSAVRVTLAVAGVVAGTLLVFSMIFCWSFVTARHRQLQEQVDDLEAEIQEFASMFKPDAANLHAALQAMAEESRDNLRMMKVAHDKGRYWKILDGAPELKHWKRHRNVVRDVTDLSHVYEAGRIASKDVERILQVRSVRIFVQQRQVKADDRLPEVIAHLEEYDRALAAANADMGAP